MAGWNPEGRKGANIPDGLADAFLFLHSNIERQLSCVCVQPDATPVSSSHDELSL